MQKNTRKGFTLIELLIVVVIIGILAAIAIPKFAATKDKAKLASVKTDVRNIMSAMEAAASNDGAYPATLTEGKDFTLSGVNAAAVTGTGNGYTITVSNSTITSDPKSCTVSAGGADGAESKNDGKIICGAAATPE